MAARESNISTPQAITGDTTFAPAPTGQESGSSAGAGKDDKAGRSLPELGKEADAGKMSEPESVRSRAIQFLNTLKASLGLNQEQADHAKNDVMAKGSGNVAVADAEVLKSVSNVTGNDITKLDPRILAMASAERDVLVNSGATIANADVAQYQAGSNKQTVSEVAHTA